jgi:hypothetical protein
MPADGELGAEKHAGQIDRAQPVPFGRLAALDVLAEKQPGIVDQNVELAEAAETAATAVFQSASAVTSRCRT